MKRDPTLNDNFDRFRRNNSECKINFRIPEDVIFRVLEDEAVILNLSTGIYFGLDSIGTRVWQLIAENASSEKIIEALSGEYAVDENQLRDDFDNLIRQLSDKGLLTADGEEVPQAG